MIAKLVGPILVTAVVALSGCATDGSTGVRIGAASTPRYDTTFGDAVRQARADQTLNPDAGRGTAPVTGLDAQSARSAVERYYDSFKAPPPTFQVLGIGGTATGQ